MTEREILFSEIDEKYGEWIEEAGDKPAIYLNIVTKMLIDERNKVEFLKKRVEAYERAAI